MATTAATSLAKDYDLPWVEKYRPHRVSDIVGNQDVVARLQVIAQGGNMPNLIFSVSSFLPLLFTNLLKEREKMTAQLSHWDLLLLENFSSAVGRGSQPSCSMKVL
jgi:hypothetical protein